MPDTTAQEKKDAITALGGTATSVARHARYTGSGLKICVPDPEHSAYFDGWYWRDSS
ncbi:hypothetical protein ACO0M4_08140 [Streptomyces sp. RGM 3693]|uniref:hypothetical protein n=1 Tax=Streptomyces sp. RGM 3693 TaxID=3413284 RepID=UPI003D2ABDDE